MNIICEKLLRLRFLFFLCVYLFYCTSFIFADTIKLKSGETLNGKFISENQDKIVFDTFKEKLTIDKKNIQSVELGYSGIPVCYKLSYNPVETCNDLLYSFTQDEIAFVVDSGSNIKKYKHIEVNFIKLTQQNAGSDILAKIPGGIKIKITNTSDEEIEGKIESVNPNQIEIIKKSGENVTLTAGDIQILYWESEGLMVKTKNVVKYTIPGFVQFDYNKPKSISLIGLTLFFGAAAYMEYNAAQKALNNNTNIIPVGDYFIVGNNFLPSNNYIYHKNRMNMAIGGLVAVGLFHFYDVFFNAEEADSISIDLKQYDFKRSPIFFQHNSYNYNIYKDSKEFEVKYTHRF